MRMISENIWLHIRQLFKAYFWISLLSVILGVCVYFCIVSDHLVNNYDGIWQLAESSYFADTWEISLGRYFLKFVTKACYGIVSMPFACIVSLLLYQTGNIFLMDVFDIKDHKFRLLFSCQIICSTVFCNTLTYSYTSIGYSFGYLFACLAVFSIAKIENIILSATMAGMLIAFSMGCYQAYIGVTCVSVIFYLMKQIYGWDENKQNMHRSVIRSLAAISCGGITYIISANLMCYLKKVTIDSYKGAASVSVGSMILNLPRTIKSAYGAFFRECSISWDMYHTHLLRLMIILLFAALVFCRMRKITGFAGKIVVILLATLIPAGANFIMVIVNEGELTEIQKSGMLVAFPIMLSMIVESGMNAAVIRKLGFLCGCVFLWLNVCMLTNDQMALWEGKTASENMAEEIIYVLDMEGWIEEGDTIEIIGRPSDNPAFRQSDIYRNANDYAKFGQWWLDADCNRKSWNGVMKAYSGRIMPFSNDNNELYYRLINDDVFKRKPDFPKKGSIYKEGNVVIVKVADVECSRD